MINDELQTSAVQSSPVQSSPVQGGALDQSGGAQPPAPRKNLSNFVILSVVLVVFIIGSLSIYYTLSAVRIAESVTVVIPRGSSVRAAADILQDRGVVHNSLFFRMAARLVAGNHIKAGEYSISPDQGLLDIALMMHEGRVVVRQITIAEGLTSHQVAAILNAENELAGEIDVVPDEGSLLPETWRWSLGDSKQQLIERMKKAQEELIAELWPRRAPDLPIQSPAEAIILASLVELETGKKPQERAQVAGVFVNRLRKGMKLQSDPTVVYGITLGRAPLGRSLTRDDLMTQSPWNTYAIQGLPPSPLCNPGRAAIEAVLNPQIHEDLYFVADGTGGHVFARTLDEHNRNVAAWIRLRKTPDDKF